MSNDLTVMWAAFAGSQLIFVVVGWTMWNGYNPEMATTAWTLAGFGLLSGLASLIVPAATIPGDDEEMVRLRFLVRWGFAESATLFGFVGTFLGGPRWLVLAMAAWGFLLLLMAIPRQGT